MIAEKLNKIPVGPVKPEEMIENPQTGFSPCQDGMAGIYPCNGYDFLGQISLPSFSASAGNDIWGWTDFVR